MKLQKTKKEGVKKMNEDEIIKLLKKDSLKALNEMIIRYTPFVS